MDPSAGGGSGPFYRCVCGQMQAGCARQGQTNRSYLEYDTRGHDHHAFDAMRLRIIQANHITHL